MIKTYHFNYDHGMAEITIEVDTNILTKESARAIMDFYGWCYNEKATCIGDVVNMCAMDVIKAGVLFGNNLPAIKRTLLQY